MFGLPHKIRKTASMLGARIFGTIVAVDTQKKEVALTFDDGPHPESTPRLLDVLSKYDAKATFFMLGVMANKYPDLVKKVAEGGHEIGNHSWDHASLPNIPAHEMEAQLMQTKKLLAPFGQSLMRPPFGHQNFWTYLLSRLCGYKVVTWNMVAEDWLNKDADWLTGKVLQKLKPGSIILYHDSLYYAFEDEYRNREATIGGVEMLFKKLPDFKFVTVSELLEGGAPIKRYWYMAMPDNLLSHLKLIKH
jgi:peptidoglycan-N-acetylglucosamine deacetylase